MFDLPQDAIAMINSLALTLNSDPDDRQALHRAVWAAMVELPSNPFYRRHEADLAPLVRQIVSDRQASAILQSEAEHGQALAFVIKDGLVGLVQHCVYLVAGYERMTALAPHIRLQMHQQSLKEFMDACDSANS